MVFGRNELIEFTLAFGCNHKELIEPNDESSSNKLIVEYSEIRYPSMQSCPSTFQFGYQIRRQPVPSIPAQANQVALLDIIASLLSNQILRELKLTTLLKTLFFVVIVVIIVAIVVVTIEGLR